VYESTTKARIEVDRAPARVAFPDDWVLAAAFASAGLTLAEVLLSPSLLYAAHVLALPYQRAAALFAVVAFMAIHICLELATFAAVRRISQRLETRLRLLLHRKLPSLDDRYVRTRPVSDLANRAQLVHAARDVPVLWFRALRSVLALGATTLGLVGSFPEGGPLLLAFVALVVSVPWLMTRALSELSMRLRTQASGLEQVYLDALTGAMPVRVHGSERALRVEHEGRLSDWLRTLRSLLRRSLAVQGAQAGISQLCVAAFVVAYWWSGQSTSAALLVALLALRLPAAAIDLAACHLQLRNLRSVVARLLAPLSAPETPLPATAAAPGEGLAIRTTWQRPRDLRRGARRSPRAVLLRVRSSTCAASASGIAVAPSRCSATCSCAYGLESASCWRALRAAANPRLPPCLQACARRGRDRSWFAGSISRRSAATPGGGASRLHRSSTRTMCFRPRLGSIC
jgi:hypothetical protein